MLWVCKCDVNLHFRFSFRIIIFDRLMVGALNQLKAFINFLQSKRSTISNGRRWHNAIQWSDSRGINKRSFVWGDENDFCRIKLRVSSLGASYNSIFNYKTLNELTNNEWRVLVNNNNLAGTRRRLPEVSSGFVGAYLFFLECVVYARGSEWLSWWRLAESSLNGMKEEECFRGLGNRTRWFEWWRLYLWVVRYLIVDTKRVLIFLQWFCEILFEESLSPKSM